MKAFLLLEDGTVFEGTHIGVNKEIISEIVFNTSMAGYVETMTDPSYAGQAVCMTYPLIGNYGVCAEDMESEKVWPDGIIVRELSRRPSNFRTDMSIQDFMEQNGVTGIAGIDTRALTKILRDKGTMNGMITTDEHYNLDEILPRLKAFTAENAVERATCAEKYTLKGSETPEENGPLFGFAVFNKADYESGKREMCPTTVKKLNGKGLKVALLDLGAKKSLAHSLTQRGCEVTVYPAATPADEILATQPDGIMISNGPGNPKDCTAIITEIKKIYDADMPVFAVGLGHQLMALATGADTCKLKYGHRGSSQPVRDVETGRVYISAQNHGYAVDEASLDANIAVPAFVNVNDGTNEGLNYVGKNIFSVQFYPAESLNQDDAGSLFDRFIRMMKEENHNA